MRNAFVLILHYIFNVNNESNIKIKIMHSCIFIATEF